MFGDGKWRMIDSLGTSALIGGGEKEGGVGMRELCGSHCLKIPRFAPVRVEALPFHRLVHQLVSPPRSAFFGSFEVGNQLDCLSTPEKSPCALPSVHSFSCSRTLSLPLYRTLTHGHATTLFFLYSLHAARSSAPILRAFAAAPPRFFFLPHFTSFFHFLPPLLISRPASFILPLFSSFLLFLTLDIVLVTHLRETIPQNVAQSALHCSRVPLSSEGLGKVCRVSAPNSRSEDSPVVIVDPLF